MKKTAILLLTTFSLSAFAQTKTSTSRTDTKQTVKDDGKTMHVKINSSTAGKEINYDRTFSVRGMSKTEKDVLLKKIADSLGIKLPAPPPAPQKVG